MTLKRRYMEINIDDVLLSQDNPRIYTTVNINRARTGDFLPESDETRNQTKLMRFLLKPNTKKLELDIIAYGGLQTPIDVEKVGDKYVVFEGNTRAAIYKQLKESPPENVEPSTWDKIPAFIYEGITEEQKAEMMNREHPQGKRQWDPYETAHYWKIQKDEIGMSLKNIARSSTKSEIEVARSIKAIDLMDQHLRPLLLESGQTIDQHKNKYNHFYQIIISSAQADALNRHNIDLDEYAKIVHEDRIKEARDVRKLNKILDNPDAKKIFLTRDKSKMIASSKEALKLVESKDVDEMLEDLDIFRLLQLIYERLEKLGPQEIRMFGDADRLLLDNLSQTIKTISSFYDSTKKDEESN